MLTSSRLGAIDRRTPVVLNIGAIDQHGGHLPLVADAPIGRDFTERIYAELGEGPAYDCWAVSRTEVTRAP
jgi:creatinine amidohydrolase